MKFCDLYVDIEPPYPGLHSMDNIDPDPWWDEDEDILGWDGPDNVRDELDDLDWDSTYDPEDAMFDEWEAKHLAYYYQDYDLHADIEAGINDDGIDHDLTLFDRQAAEVRSWQTRSREKRREFRRENFEQIKRRKFRGRGKHDRFSIRFLEAA